MKQELFQKIIFQKLQILKIHLYFIAFTIERPVHFFSRHVLISTELSFSRIAVGLIETTAALAKSPDLLPSYILRSARAYTWLCTDLFFLCLSLPASFSRTRAKLTNLWVGGWETRAHCVQNMWSAEAPSISDSGLISFNHCHMRARV